MRFTRVNILQKRHSHFNAPHLSKNEANYSALSPLTFFRRTVLNFPSSPAYTYEGKTVSYGELNRRVSKFASAVTELGLKKGDVVSVMTGNTPPLFEAHFALPGVGIVLHSINTRLDAASIAYQLKHSEAKIVIVDAEYNQVMLEARDILKADTQVPLFVNIQDPSCVAKDPLTQKNLVGSVEYEDLLKSGDENFKLMTCVDEWDAIALNYTSGTTGNPKGVVVSHRGAYLAALNHVIELNMARYSGLLMITPMFHANAWTFPWSLCSVAGCNHLLRYVRANQIFDLFERYKVDYMIGAPITMTTLLSHPNCKKISYPATFLTAGSPPPPSLIRRFTEETNISVTTAYGLTEASSVLTKHIPEPEWHSTNKLTAEELVARCTRQATDNLVDDIQVIDPETMQQVPSDGATVGEVMIKSNTLMKGYFKNPKATEEAFHRGWFHTGDLAVNHGLGRFEIKDRSKDIIISGGENISSIEVQDILATHPSVLEVAVVAMPDEKWGEVPCAFIARDPNAPEATEEELIAWARTKMARFQAPKKVVFGELLKTATGKVQKHLLRKLL